MKSILKALDQPPVPLIIPLTGAYIEPRAALASRGVLFVMPFYSNAILLSSCDGQTRVGAGVVMGITTRI